MLKRRRLEIKILKYLQGFGLTEDRVFLVLTITVGAACGLAAVLFNVLIEWINQLTVQGALNQGSIWYFVFPSLGGLLAGSLLVRVPDARGSGIPEVKTSFFMQYGYIPLKVVFGKIFLGATCIGSGFSLGREGPTVQICSGMASFMGRIFSLSRQRVRMLIPVGAAAGLAAAFNTPIAAVTFTLEEVVGDVNGRILGSTVVAAVTASMVEHSILGDSPLFGISVYHLRNPLDLLFYFVLGVIGGFVSVAFVRGLLWLRGRFKRFPRSKRLHPAIGGATVGFISLLAPRILGVGYPTVRLSLEGKLVLGTLIVLFLLKFGATIISYACGASGGLFSPTLFIGATLGGGFGAALQHYFPTLAPNTGAFALVGMGTLFAGIIRAPMTSVLIIFEMTRDYQIILPLMVSNVVSYYISQRFQGVSIYDALALQDGIHLPRPHHEHVFQSLTVQEAMVRDVVTLPDHVTLGEAWKLAHQSLYHGFPVLDERDHFKGMISLREMKQLSAAGREGELLSSVMKMGGAHAHPDQTLEIVLRKFGQYGVSRLPVLSRADPNELLGLITPEDVMKAFGVVREKEREERLDASVEEARVGTT